MKFLHEIIARKRQQSQPLFPADEGQMADGFRPMEGFAVEGIPMATPEAAEAMAQVPCDSVDDPFAARLADDSAEAAWDLDSTDATELDAWDEIAEPPAEDALPAPLRPQISRWPAEPDELGTAAEDPLDAWRASQSPQVARWSVEPDGTAETIEDPLEGLRAPQRPQADRWPAEADETGTAAEDPLEGLRAPQRPQTTRWPAEPDEIADRCEHAIPGRGETGTSGPDDLFGTALAAALAEVRGGAAVADAEPFPDGIEDGDAGDAKPDLAPLRRKIWDLNDDDEDEVAERVPPAPLGRPVVTTPVGTDPDPSRRRPGRVKTRLLGFHKVDEDTAPDPFAAQAPSAAAGQPSFPVGWMIVIDGPGRGAAFELQSGASRIGRGEDQAIRLDFGDTAISRDNHAAVAYDDEMRRFYVGHGGKANLVRLNNMPVLATEPLSDGDLIRIGETTLRFVALCGEDFSWSETPGDKRHAPAE